MYGYYTCILAENMQPVFAASMVGFPDHMEKAALYRGVVRKYAEERLAFTDGLWFLLIRFGFQ